MSRPRGGYIGFNRVPAAAAVNSAASGVWTLREAEALKRAGTWPLVGASLPVTSGLQLWLDASDSATLFDATTGGSLVAADGGVSRWEDKSGSGRHATQGTSANRPARKTAIQGSKDVLRFDGSNDSLSIPSSTATFNFLHGADSTVFAVVKAGTTANPNAEYAFLGTHNGSGGTNGITLWYADFVEEGFNPNDQLRVIVGAAGGAGAVVDSADRGVGGFTANTFKVLSVITKPTQATAANRLSARVNGGSAVSGNQATKAASAADASGDLTLGSSSGATFFLNGDIAEIIIYNSALSDTDRAAVESYLISKWGIT
jgi:hypothetical protein